MAVEQQRACGANSLFRTCSKACGASEDLFMDLANLGHGLLVLQDWICSRWGDVGGHHKTIEVFKNM